jgi:hypothetical protein
MPENYAEAVAAVALLRFSFSSTLNVTSGTTYWIVVRPSISSSTYVYWPVSCKDQVMPGAGKMQNGSGPWAPLPFVPQQGVGGVTENCPNAFRITSP